VAETLYIRLGSKKQAVVHWLILSAHGEEIIASGELKSAEQLSDLAEKASQRQVNVLVPSCDVLLKRLTVPGKSQRAVKLAVPYMLEEDLAQDVEEMFFAYADMPEDEQGHNCFTAIVAHEQMEAWQSWLNDAGITAKTMLPEVLAMPLLTEQWSAIALDQSDNAQVIVRQGAWQGFTLDAMTWQLQCHSLDTEDNESEPVSLAAYSPLAHSEQLSVNAMPEELPLALLAKHFSQSKFNLLQGDYKVRSEHSMALKHWMSVAAMAVFALLLTFANKGAQLWQLNEQVAKTEQAIVDSYKKAFPKTKRVRVSTIKSQLNQKLAQLGGANDSEGFLAMLAKVQPAFTQVPQLKPNSLKFDGKRQELRIQALADNYQHFEQFKAALENTGLTIKQGAQNNQGDKVSGSFSIVNKPNSKARGGKS